MNELSTYRWTFDQDVSRYAEAGYEAIGVWRSKLADFGEEKGVELLRDQPLNVSSLLWSGGFTGCDGRPYQESIEDAVEAIELAADLRADCLVVYTGSRFGHTHSHARRIGRNALRELIPVAESNGVDLAIEPVPSECGGEWTFLHDLDSALRFIDEFDSSRVKLAFDTYHLGREDVDLSHVESIGSRVGIVHLGDARHTPRGEQNRCLLGAGRVPIADIVSALVEGGYRGYCDVKLFGEDLELCSYDEVLGHSRAALSQLIGV